MSGKKSVLIAQLLGGLKKVIRFDGIWARCGLCDAIQSGETEREACKRLVHAKDCPNQHLIETAKALRHAAV